MSRRARRGMGATGFEVFYRDAKDPCFRALLVTVGSAEEADDLLSESFTRALAKWDEVSAHPRPEAWVVRTALNLHRDRWRRSTRRRRRMDSVDVVPFTTPIDSELLDALRALPHRQREVVALRVLLDLSAEQTADALDIEIGTVGTHLRRALATLQDIVSATDSYGDAIELPTRDETPFQASTVNGRADESVGDSKEEETP